MTTTQALELTGQHPIYIRGPAVTIWNHVARAVDDGIEPPPEIMIKSRAGTGKSMGVLATMIAIAERFPNVPGRVLILRLTRRSLTTSACVTIRKIVHRSHPMLRGAADTNRSDYWIGRWNFVLGGCDNLDNLLSSEWDFIVPDEARQISLDDWERLSRGMRNNAFFQHDINGDKVALNRRGIDSVSPIPFGILVGATNPWTRKFWFNMRAKQGRLLMLSSRLEDNPAYADPDENGNLVLNLEGRAYDKRMRATNTGTRLRRLVDGEDCSAEGMIYEEWEGDPDKINHPDSNLVRLPRGEDGWITLETLKALDVREFYCGVDFGDAAPGCVLLAGYTGDKKLIVICEAYARRRHLEWWTDIIKQMHAHYPITLGFCDHNRIDMVRAFNDVVGAPREGPGAIFVNATKGKERGRAITRLRIKDRTIVFDVDALVHPPDPLCIADGIPYQTVDEIPDLIHKRDDDGDDTTSSEKRQEKSDPKCHDHGTDALEYLSTGVDTMEPEKKLKEPLSPLRANYLKGLYLIPVIGFEDENSLAQDMHDMGDDEIDYLQEMRDKLHRPIEEDDQ